jgi:hypothetical protein
MTKFMSIRETANPKTSCVSKFIFGPEKSLFVLMNMANDFLAAKELLLPKYRRIQGLCYKDCGLRSDPFYLDICNAKIRSADQHENAYMVMMLNFSLYQSFRFMLFYGCRLLIHASFRLPKPMRQLTYQS